MKNVNWSKLLKVLKPNPAHSSWLAAQKHWPRDARASVNVVWP